MPKPKIYPVKKLIRMDAETFGAVEKFRSEQEPPINSSEAVRRILSQWLVTHGYKDMES